MQENLKVGGILRPHTASIQTPPWPQILVSRSAWPSGHGWPGPTSVVSSGSECPSQEGRVKMRKEPWTMLSPWPHPSTELGEAKNWRMNESAQREAETMTQLWVMISLLFA